MSREVQEKAAPASAESAANKPKAAAKPAAKATRAKKAVAVKKVPAKKAVGTKSAAKKAASPAKTAVKVAKPAAPAEKSAKHASKPAAKEKVKKAKLVRDSFTMPESEYQVLGDVKKAFLKIGISIKKSELLRAGVALIKAMEISRLKTVIGDLPPLKPGRPKKDK